VTQQTGAGQVVIFRPGALGDTLLAFPTLAVLRQVWPNAHITLVARADVLPLARGAGLADATYSYDLPAWSGLWGAAEEADPLLRDVVDGADVVVAWLRDPDGAVVRTLRALGVGRVVIAPGRPPEPQPDEPAPRLPAAPFPCAVEADRPAAAGGRRSMQGSGPGEREHAARYLLRTLAPLGIADAPLLAPISRKEGASCDALEAQEFAGKRMVALHPGSGGAAKRWPPERFAGIARRLRAAGHAPLLVEGPGDAEQVAAVRAEVGDAPAPLARGLAVEALAALLTNCLAYVGNDSGVSHLAGLVGCPTLALFGPSDPAQWAPVGPRVRVLRAPSLGATAPSMSDLSEETVWSALMTLL
jgi:ADP-heptose:LPS heptosyltransferase